jgi:hypothetical protein
MTAMLAQIQTTDAELIRSDLRAALFVLASDPKACRAPEAALATVRVMSRLPVASVVTLTLDARGRPFQGCRRPLPSR